MTQIKQGYSPGQMTQPLFVSATTLEARFFIEQTATRPRWQKRLGYLFHAGDGFNFAVTGMGTDVSRSGIETALDEIGPVSEVIGIGFCGGLVKTTKAGDLTIPTSVQLGTAIETPTEWLRMALSAFADSNAWRKLITVEKLASSPAEKAALYAATDAETVDMESGQWGHACSQRNIPWAIVRTVMDTAVESLPEELSQTVDSFGRVRWRSVLPFFATHPGLISPALKMTPGALRRLAQPYAAVANRWLTAKRHNRRYGAHQPGVVSEVTKSA